MKQRREGLATLEEAVRWVDQHWSEQPTPPIRIHQQGVEPESQLGAPRVAAVFWRYLTVSGDAMEYVSTTEPCYHPKLPQHWDAMEQRSILHGVLCSCTFVDCDRLHCPDCMGMGTITQTAERFRDPMRQAIQRLSRKPKWYAIIVAMARVNWHWVKAGVTAEEALTAIRMLHFRYTQTGGIKWTEMSESQQRAETVAA